MAPLEICGICSSKEGLLDHIKQTFLLDEMFFLRAVVEKLQQVFTRLREYLVGYDIFYQRKLSWWYVMYSFSVA